LRAYQSIRPELSSRGATLVAVSPMLPDNSLSTVEKNELEFEVLSDVGNEVARRYGLVFRLSDEVRLIYQHQWSILLPEVNGDGSWELPIPGTFVIGRDGAVSYAFVEPDYTRRADPDELLAAVSRA
jgi:peroxiredoxin